VEYCALGHKVSGNLNFPRRINTAFLNASVYKIHKKFVDSVKDALKLRNIVAPVYMLKADGGTIKIEESLENPAQTITSGPAASIMGILGLVREKECVVALDIGGTTTDIAIIHKGAPLLEPEGIKIGKYNTLIRALLTRSIGVAGDSKVKFIDGKFIIGPERESVAFCMGGSTVTPTDAARVLGISDYGDENLAIEGIRKISNTCGKELIETAQEIVDVFVATIADNINEMISYLNERPVYTIHELIEGAEIKPTLLAVIGGPATTFGKLISEKIKCRLVIPPYVRVANALGAAIARTTTEVSIHCDTSAGYAKCIEEETKENTTHGYSLHNAEEFAKRMLLQRAKRLGADEENIEAEIVEANSFNMVRGFYTAGKNIRVKAQVKPCIIKQFL